MMLIHLVYMFNAQPIGCLVLLISYVFKIKLQNKKKSVVNYN
jgi:hypothetical protein